MGKDEHCKITSVTLPLPKARDELQVPRFARLDVSMADEEVDHDEVDVWLERIRRIARRGRWAGVARRAAVSDASRYLIEGQPLERGDLAINRRRREGPRQLQVEAKEHIVLRQYRILIDAPVAHGAHGSERGGLRGIELSSNSS